MRCEICGDPKPPKELAHIEATRLGSEATRANLILVCANCHALIDADASRLASDPADREHMRRIREELDELATSRSSD
jgi:5-methylcytosine-specific restriction endonuclease McrA